jgi:hypothetical protein
LHNLDIDVNQRKSLPMVVEASKVNNVNWYSYKKLWIKYKIDRKNGNKTEEIITAKKLVALAKTITDGKGNPITVPFFPILGNNQ